MRARATRGPVSLCPRVSERVSDAHTVLEYTFLCCLFDFFRAVSPRPRRARPALASRVWRLGQDDLMVGTLFTVPHAIQG